MLECAPVAVTPSPLPWFGAGRFPLYLAPMAGFTDSPFRRLCKEQGADVLVTEFANAEGLVRGTEAVWRDLHFTAAERPLGIQIFGGDPALMAEAARMVSARLQPDFIDLNFGCPADKVTCRNAGSSLLRDLPLLGANRRGGRARGANSGDRENPPRLGRAFDCRPRGRAPARRRGRRARWPCMAARRNRATAAARTGR